MSDIEKASQDAVQAAQQGETYAAVLAALHAAQQQAPACQHQQAPPPAATAGGGAAKWIGIGIGGSALLGAGALFFMAFSFGAVALTICVLVLYGIYKDVRGTKG